MYTVKLYNNTGFNVENIPDSATLLGTPSIEKTAVDTVQNYVMTSVRISAIFDDVKNADYCQIGDFYYFIAGVTMSSRDVAILSLIPDYITSFGISNLNFLDGITVRHHVDDDSFGLYTEDDPLLYCNEPLVLEKGDMLFAPNQNTQNKTIVLSTIDLETAGGGTSFNSVTYSDSSGNEVTVPHLPQIPDTTLPTLFTMGSNAGPAFSIPNNIAYDMANNLIRAGVQYCRDIAAETSIIGCYQLPDNLGEVWEPTPNSGVYQAVIGYSLYEASGVHYSGYISQTPRNARVLYGEYNKFGLLSMSGNRIEAKPEEIYDSSSSTQPEILCLVDPRPDGKPYFRFEYINHETPVTPGSKTSGGHMGLDYEKFWFSVIPGEPWYQVPLVFTTPSGIIQQQKYYDQSRKLADYAYGQNDMANQFRLITSIGAGALNFANGLGTETITTKVAMRDYASDFGQVGTTINKSSVTRPITTNNGSTGLTQQSGVMGSLVNSRLNTANYNYQKGLDAYNLGLAKEVVVPDVMFPYTNGTIRDYAGNGVVCYRYHPSDADAELQDKILTMYGYRVTDKLVKAHFYNRQYFNYVQANSVSIGNHIPQWWKAGIIAQLAGGVRVWHVTPDETHYDNNPIVVNP